MKIELTKKEIECILQLMGNGYCEGDFYADGKNGFGGKREIKAAKSAYRKLAEKIKYQNTDL